MKIEFKVSGSTFAEVVRQTEALAAAFAEGEDVRIYYGKGYLKDHLFGPTHRDPVTTPPELEPEAQTAFVVPVRLVVGHTEDIDDDEDLGD
ncbi:hypothetical protein LQ327_08860 [Actinomycetospora endophytica]|uniref:Uncharacterized protein n=1 Tax=Actinomycetospora endophytica TaxID=2291215 RepID=A0ABS8P5H9_9PSEU|nr:hypothetical protein [Actinomycetospora endophytica]MCD2193491.1 hypothetical protein [Actinomycetospora endophytica]